ncbi:hypothetical protein WR25_15393 [Diploscapter pachys]|uniref:Receptor expression-enhancing protein n=1 Tax=Diploscapter pachys TaxID=2018661 RepID=A0A2A2LUD3_9BILA|nr:hypothetical protein WR25_15393 [Diploscapter pachys]
MEVLSTGSEQEASTMVSTLRLVNSVIGLAIPAYRTIKMLRKPLKADLIHWVQYWVVIACLFFAEALLEYFYLDNFIPLYELQKTFVLGYMQMPVFCGAQVVFVRILMPFIRRYEKRFDEWIWNWNSPQDDT